MVSSTSFIFPFIQYNPNTSTIKSWTSILILDCIFNFSSCFLYLQINSSFHHPGQWHDLLVRPKQVYNPGTSERSMWYHITNLVPESVYECLVQTRNQHGFGELSELHQWFNSPRGRPSIYSNRSLKIKSSSSFLVILIIFFVFRFRL